jgi:hypothetical protein
MTATKTRAQTKDLNSLLVWRESSQKYNGVHGESRLRPAKDKPMSQKMEVGGVRGSQDAWGQ